MNRQYAFSRNFEGESVVVTVNNDDSDFVMTVPAGNAAEYMGALSGQRVCVENGNICVNVRANAGEIWLPVTDKNAGETADVKPVEFHPEDAVKEIPASAVEEAVLIDAPEEKAESSAAAAETSGEFERGRIAGLQEAIIAIMEKNGPVTDQMRKDVTDNVYHDSLITWIKSFR